MNKNQQAKHDEVKFPALPASALKVPEGMGDLSSFYQHFYSAEQMHQYALNAIAQLCAKPDSALRCVAWDLHLTASDPDRESPEVTFIFKEPQVEEFLEMGWALERKLFSDISTKSFVMATDRDIDVISKPDSAEQMPECKTHFDVVAPHCAICLAEERDSLQSQLKQAQEENARLRDGLNNEFYRGVIASLGALAPHSKHGDVFHDEIVKSVGKEALYATAEPDDIEWAALDPEFYAAIQKDSHDQPK